MKRERFLPLYGDGIHDDTAAVQQRLDRCGCLLIPAGSFRMTAPLLIRLAEQAGGTTRMNRLLNEPVALGVAIRMSLLAAIAFGLNMTETQMLALMGAVEAVLGLFTRQSVTPNQLAEERVARGGSPTKPLND